MFGPGAAGWAEQGILVIAGLFDFEVRAADGELLGLIKRGGQGDTCNPPHPLEPVTYRAVIRADVAEAWPEPPSVPFPAGFVPPDPVRAAAGERARWGGTGTGTAAGVTVSTARVMYEAGQRCPDCTCSSANGCHPGPDSECPWNERLCEYTCPCTAG